MSVVSASKLGTFNVPITITPTIITTATASNVLVPLFNSITLPKGVWLLTGSAVYTGANLTAVQVNAVLGATNIFKANNVITGTTESVTLNCIVEADGATALTVSATNTTSAGNYQASADTRVKLIRIA